MSTRPPFENSIHAANPFAIVIFGASGDLTSRKLIPALFALFLEKRLPENFEIIGFARRDKSNEDFHKELIDVAQKYSRHAPISTQDWEAFCRHVTYHRGEFDQLKDYEVLREEKLELFAEEKNIRQHVFYMATSPEYFATIGKNLNAAKLVGLDLTARVVIEKPLGNDAKSATALLKSLHESLEEKNIYHIDHYLGKETVQNLLYFRFGNLIYEPLWNNHAIDSVQITVAEEEGVGKRGGYYDGVGATRDMIQNHLMQLLTLTAMEPPTYGMSASIRDEKAKILRAISTPTFETLRAVRGQYDGYRDEERVSKTSTTETYSAVRLYIDNWRWAGVPFYLRTGKHLPRRCSEIIISFKRLPLNFFDSQACLLDSENRIHIRLQPREGIQLRFNVKKPGTFLLEPVEMDFEYKSKFGSYSPEAYERLLFDAIIGDPTLFTRADETLEGWRIADGIIDSWQQQPLHSYAKGSWGPKASDEMLMKHSRKWIEPGV